MSKNGKESCNCKRENYTEGIATFRLFPIYDNKFAPISRNPRKFITTNLNSGKINFNPNRVKCETCDNQMTTQEKLEIKKKPTPFRMPYNHYRKRYTCDPQNICDKNVKVIKEVKSQCECPKTLITNRLVGKTGVRFINDTTYKNYLQNNGKLFSQNAQGLLNENRVYGEKYTFKIGNLENTRYNKNFNPIPRYDCMVYDVKPVSLTNINYEYRKVPTATKKYKNPKFGKNTSVSSRSRLNRLKYNTVMSSQINHSKTNKTAGCVNGEICSTYKNPQLNINSKNIPNECNKLPCPQ